MNVRAPQHYRTRSCIHRLVIAFAALAQLCVLALAPAAEAREAKSTAAHIEAQGSRTHWVHNKDSCLACVARALVGNTPRPVPAPPSVVVDAAVPVRAPFAPVVAACDSPGAPRAPPAIA